MSTNTPHTAFKSRTLIVLISASFALAGCATFSKDGGFGAVQDTVQKHIKQEVVWPKTEGEKNQVTERVNELLSKRLNVEQAVQVALLNNKGLQADFYNLGISESDLVQAGRLPNPKFSMGYLRNNGEYSIDQALTFNIFSLITMPKMQEIERQRFVQTQKKTAFEVIKIANHTRIAYFNAVAATEQVRYSEQVKESAEASAELARRMVKAGNFNKLQQAREQSFYADAALDYASASNKQVSAYEALSRLLGVSVDQFNLEERLPMMAGIGQFGAIDMGGMFTTLKVREGLMRNDYKDPGPYKNPKGTVAHEVINDLPPVERTGMSVPLGGMELNVRKPKGHMGH